MRCSAVLILAAAISSVSAAGLNRRQDVPSYPTCALSCLANADFGNCDPVDNGCLCKSDAFIQGTTQCINAACSGADLEQADSAAQSACAAVGVTLSSSAPAATQTAPASSGSASASATPSVTSSGSASASPSQTPNAASSRGANALAALAVVGAAAFAL